MNLYRLEAILSSTPVSSFSANFEFVAEHDNEARELVLAFSRVCQPMAHGPLYCIGESKNIDGLDAIYPHPDEKDWRPVSLEVQRL